MGLLDLLFGQRTESKETPLFRVSEHNINGLLRAANETYQKTRNEWHAGTVNCLLAETTYFQLLAIAKSLRIPDSSSDVVEAERLYNEARSEEFAKDYNAHVSEANIKLATAIGKVRGIYTQ